MNNELSELQAVDFAVGEFIAKAYDDLSTTTGPKEWREFLGRATTAQVYRHDAASPGDFLKALQASRKAETGPTNNRSNSPTLPAIYYFRKPGFSNVNDRSKELRGRYVWGEDLSKAYNIRMLHLDLDYTIVFTAWDKPTLDKLCMAWYAYIFRHDTMQAKYQIGSDIMEVPVTVQDHCNLTISDSSEPAENGRLFAATTNYTMHTMILFGAEIATPPATIRIQYGLAATERERYTMGYGDGVNSHFTWNGLDALGKNIRLSGIAICLDGEVIATLWDGTEFKAVDPRYEVTGAVALDPASISVDIVPPPAHGVTVALCADTGVQMVGSGCPSCHRYA